MIADEPAKRKLFDSDFRYSTLNIRAGFGWPFSSTGRIAKTDANSLVLGLFRCHQAQVGGGADLFRPDKTNFLERR